MRSLLRNSEKALPGLLGRLFAIYPIDSEELPDDIQHTKERKPDLLKKVTDWDGKTFVLHIEFRVSNDPDMIFRMAEYYIMLYRRYRLPVRQYVFYLGEGKPAMLDFFRSEQMLFCYQLFAFSEIDYQVFLRADNPEGKMLAILANFGKEDPKSVIENIVNQVVALSEGDLSKRKYIQQLRISPIA